MRTSLSALVVLTCALSAGAETDPRVSLPVTAKQHALDVAVAREGDRIVGVRARACTATPCDASGSDLVAFPEDVDGAAVTIERVPLAAGRFVALVRAPTRSGGGNYTAVLWPSDRGADAVVNTLSGHFDAPKPGIEGERKTLVLLREPATNGERLLVGTRYENVSVCDRPAVMGLKWLDPDTMRWTPVGARSLGDEDRKNAVPVAATPLAEAPRSEPSRAEPPRVLSPRLASSAVGRSVKHAADRDPSTRWAEAKPGAGSGEFVVLNAAHEVPIEAFEIVVRGDERPGAAPKSFFVALPSAVYRVTMPHDAMAQPAGTTYEIVLPEPVHTDCVTIVLDEAYGDGEVGFAEIHARTAFDDKSPTDLVAMLEGPDRVAAKALLLRGGPTATEAAMKGYPGLDRDGRAAALEIVDAGPCDLTSPFYVDLLLGEGRGDDFNPALDRLAGHARDRLRGCRGPAVERLTATMRDAGPSQRRVWAARELVDLDPGGSIATILDVLTEGSTAPAEPGGADEVRRGLRAALAIAARHRRAHEAVESALAGQTFAKRSLVERIDLLRAVGPELSSHQSAAGALEQVLASDRSFRTRYLLLEPAAVLAQGGHRPSLDLIEASLGDPEPALRAQAATTAGGIPALAPALAKALHDDNPRVRTAALETLARTPAVDLGARIIPLLRDDPWTFVRRGAASALGGIPLSPETDEALVAAIEDPSPIVRRAALRAIGKRRQITAGKRVHAIADDPRQDTDTRVAAIDALGALCRHDSVELLTKLALRAGFQQLPYDQPLGIAALDALGDLHPADLRERLAPLLAPNARIPVPIRRIAHAVLQRPGRCGGNT